jgi:hypothetical protein
MTPKVVDLQGKPRPSDPAPVSHFWFAQVDVRLGRIEFIVTRLERQVWMIVCGLAAMLILEIVKALSGSAL